MSKLLKVTLEFEDKVLTAEGSEAEKWNSHNEHVASFAEVHNFNPFTNDPIKWQEVSVEDLPKVSLSDGTATVSFKSPVNGTNSTEERTNLNRTKGIISRIENSTGTVFNGSLENPVLQQSGESTKPETTIVTGDGKLDGSTPENLTSQEQLKKKGPKGKQA